MKLTDKAREQLTMPGDSPTTKKIEGHLDLFETPINLAKLRDAITNLGVLRMRAPGNPYAVEVNITQCTCGECNEEVVQIQRTNGLFSIQWLMSTDELVDDFETLDELRECVVQGALNCTSAERQAIEQHIKRTLGKSYVEVAPVCHCAACAAAVGDDAVWRHILLSQLAARLCDRHDFIDLAIKALGADATGWIDAAFDRGYQMGRIYSEFQVKDGIEPLAMRGKDFDAVKAKRAHAAGMKSSGMRTKRVEALLDHMERLAQRSPDALRFGPDELAKLAGTDAAMTDPKLWHQGIGQVSEYLGMIRRGEAGPELKARYLALFPAKKRSAAADAAS